METGGGPRNITHVTQNMAAKVNELEPVRGRGRPNGCSARRTHRRAGDERTSAVSQGEEPVMGSSDHSGHEKVSGAKRRVASNVDEELEELALRARDGDAVALDDLLRRIQPEVLRRCSRFLPYRQDAEEA